ncbi:chorismate mutase [Pseudovibrio sp. Tun.PSC04-5.I4]|uniref:chorismate mutase n=1 Tax=Pseudovibrio sp. Tun.PSC04-5.I4 TaxID=1798213 RepID=UPI00088DE7C6|nr:chorismate mutase [Pseudovibrio sp. Tun.PSC04-5.I4]SDR28062.1 chorismate mutase domain-containing protein [Pseudovibrio sp. Tun.PSC04-5.I4]
MSGSASAVGGKKSLSQVRDKLDEVDDKLHALLMERADLIEHIVAAKAEQGSMHAVFRPSREAEIMRRLVENHKGVLPVLSLEHIWREVISSLTNTQTTYRVHLDGSADRVAMSELARFYFGFAIDFLREIDPSAVLSEVDNSQSDLGIVALEERADTPWWRGLGEREDGSKGPSIISRLPFLVMQERPADLPVLVIAAQTVETEKPDICIYDVRWTGTMPNSLMHKGIEVLSFYRSFEGVDALLAVPGDISENELTGIFGEAEAMPDKLRSVGGYPAPLDLDDEFDSEVDANI